MLIILTLLSTILLFADSLHTIQIAKNPDKWFEINLILGEHPTVRSVVSYFSICILANISLTSFALFLNDGILNDTVTIVNIGIIALEIWCIANNIKLKIPFK